MRIFHRLFSFVCRYIPVRTIYLCLGFVFLVVGIIGVILPLIPGTVNLLIATYFFAKSSPRMEAWILNHKVLGPPIHNWRTDRSMTIKAKITAISMMWAGILWGVYAAPLIGGITAVLLGIYGTWYISTRKTRVEPPKVQQEKVAIGEPAEHPASPSSTPLEKVLD